MTLSAFSSNVYPNIIDWAKLHDPNGEVADIAYLLAQCNDVLKDVIWQESNLPMGHSVTVQTGLPQGTWRGNNQGVPSSKSLAEKIEFGIGVLTDYSKIDKIEAELNGTLGKFRMTIDNQHIQGMGQQVAYAFFYANEATNPQQFTGFSPFYNTVTASRSLTSKNVINAGGSGSANTSLWLVGWGDDTTFGLFPKGSQAGLVFKDHGDVRELYDSNGNGFEGYTSYFEWKVGLALKNWQYNARLCNIDTTTAAGGLLGTTPPDLNVFMATMVNKLPTLNRRSSGITEVDAPTDPQPGINPAFYCNRTVRTALDVQAIRDKNVLIGMKEYAGEPVLMWRDIPIRVVDQLINAEATIS